MFVGAGANSAPSSRRFASASRSAADAAGSVDRMPNTASPADRARPGIDAGSSTPAFRDSRWVDAATSRARRSRSSGVGGAGADGRPLTPGPVGAEMAPPGRDRCHSLRRQPVQRAADPAQLRLPVPLAQSPSRRALDRDGYLFQVASRLSWLRRSTLRRVRWGTGWRPGL